MPPCVPSCRKKNNDTAWRNLYQNLQTIDPETAGRLKPNDSQRIERALEVYRLTGKPLSVHFAEKADYTPPLDLCTTALIPETAPAARKHRPPFHTNAGTRLHRRNARPASKISRVDRRYASMRCVGYRQAWDYLEA